MPSLSLFEKFAIGFGLVVCWLVFLTLWSRKNERSRRIALSILGASVLILGIGYLVLALLLFLDTGLLYHSNRGGVVVTAPGHSLLLLVLGGFLATLPALLLAGLGWAVLRTARVGPNNSFKPKPLRGSA